MQELQDARHYVPSLTGIGEQTIVSSVEVIQRVGRFSVRLTRVEVRRFLHGWSKRKMHFLIARIPASIVNGIVIFVLNGVFNFKQL